MNYNDDWLDQFNDWRENYDALTFADQQQAMSVMGAIFPEQHSTNIETIDKFFASLPIEDLVSISVVELGGWDGNCAREMLNRHSNRLHWWRNIELWAEAPRMSVCDDPRYTVELLHGWVWDGPPISADVFVACHTLEHIKAHQLEKLAPILDVEYVYLEMPIGAGDRTDITWKNYYGTHILEWEWGPVIDCLARYGFHLAGADGDARWFTT